MQAVSISTEDGQIWIEQQQGEEYQRVVIDVSQVPTVVQWLQEASTELLTRV